MKNYVRKQIKEDVVRYYDENDELHRIDGPAVEYTNGSKYWFVEGKYHRLDGPAIS